MTAGGLAPEMGHQPEPVWGGSAQQASPHPIHQPIHQPMMPMMPMMPMYAPAPGSMPQHAPAQTVMTGHGRRRSESPEGASAPWIPRSFPVNFDVPPVLGQEPPSMLIQSIFQGGAVFGVGGTDHHGGSGGGGHGNGGSSSSYNGGSSNNSRHRELAPAQTRHARRVFVGNIPVGCKDSQLGDFFDGILRATLPPGYLQRYDEKIVIAVSIPSDKQFGFVEFSTMEIAAASITLQNIAFNHRSDVPVSHLTIKRPNDYKPEFVTSMREVPILNLQAIGLGGGVSHIQSSSSISQTTLSKSVPDGPNKIFVGGLPHHLPEKDVLEVLETFGPLKAFNLVRDTMNPSMSKGFAFCEYLDPNLTPIVVEKLHGLALGDGKSLTVKIASYSDGGRGGSGGGGGGSGGGGVPGGGNTAPPSGVIAQSAPMIGGMPMPVHSGLVGWSGGIGVPQPSAYSVGYGMPAPPPLPYPQQQVAPPTNSKVLRLSNMVTPIELQDDQEFAEISSDIRDECSLHAKVVHIVIPRIKDGHPPNAEGLIFVEFDSPYGASQASRALIGRKFSERVVVVEFFDEHLYARRIYQ